MRRNHSAACSAATASAMHACFLRAALACAVPAASVLVITYIHAYIHAHIHALQNGVFCTSYIGQVGGGAERILKRNLRASPLGAASCVLHDAKLKKRRYCWLLWGRPPGAWYHCLVSCCVCWNLLRLSIWVMNECVYAESPKVTILSPLLLAKSHHGRGRQNDPDPPEDRVKLSLTRKHSFVKAVYLLRVVALGKARRGRQLAMPCLGLAISGCQARAPIGRRRIRHTGQLDSRRSDTKIDLLCGVLCSQVVQPTPPPTA